MIIVTGGAGFIGSNIIYGLNLRGFDEILVVDNLTLGVKYKNLVNCVIADYMDKDVFLEKIQKGDFDNTSITAVFHEGACSATTEWDGRYMMANNYQYSQILLNFCERQQIPFIYASSAAVYGDIRDFKEDPSFESPLNVYGYSKYLFDQYIRRQQDKLTTQVVGLRYFNVYGPRESHKDSMSSVAYHLNNQLLDGGSIRLFEGCDGYSNGEQRRDFIYINDVVAVNLWFLDNPDKSGIFNVGTGRSQTFNEVAQAVINFHGRGALTYVPFPEHLVGCYQSFTEANLENLRASGCGHQFMSVEDGVSDYLTWLNPK